MRNLYRPVLSYGHRRRNVQLPPGVLTSANHHRLLLYMYIQIAPYNLTLALEQEKDRSTGPAAATDNPRNLSKSRAGRSCVKTLFYVCTSFKHILFLFQVIAGAADASFNCAHLLSFIIFCTNPFIYSFNYEEFKVGLRMLGQRKQTQQ